jgi:hypothetical protein
MTMILMICSFFDAFPTKGCKNARRVCVSIRPYVRLSVCLPHVTALYTNKLLSQTGYYYNRLKPDAFLPERPSSVNNVTTFVQQVPAGRI